MTSKIIEILKSGSITVPMVLITNYKKLKITEKELIVIMYLINNNEFDPETRKCIWRIYKPRWII